MNCNVCDRLNVEHPAVALCHNCSAGLCRQHALEASQKITYSVVLNRIVTLPIAAREFLCYVCKQALEQPRRIA